ncbi:MAG: membrane protein insertase YidC [bacterium]
MEKRAILAILLLFIVLSWYNLFVVPKYQRKPQSPGKAQAEQVDTSVVSKPILPRLHPDTTTAERQVIVRTPLYTACFSSRGAMLTSWQLSNYIGIDGTPVDLVAGKEQVDFPLATILLFKDGERLDLSQYDFKSADESIFVDAGQTAELRFQLDMDTESWLTKTYVITGDTYHIFAKVNMSGSLSREVRAIETGWYSGLPTTEANKGDDLRNFSCMAEGSEGLTKIEISKIRKHREIPVAGAVRWTASKTKYFVSAIDLDPAVYAVSRAFAIGDERIGIAVEADIKQGEDIVFGVYAGPLDYYRLKELGIGIEKAVDFGWRWILPLSKLIFAFMVWIYKFIPNYGVVIILLSGLTKLIFHPLSQKSMKSMREMQLLQPEINALREKYKNEPEKLNRALLQLYKEKGINPVGGCLPLLLQMPVFISLFNVLSRTIELRRAPFVLWIKDLSTPDVIWQLSFSLPFIGNAVSLLPILMGIAMFIQQKMTTTDPKQAVMTYAMPIIFTVMFFRFPSGLVLYWLVNNVITIGHQYLMTRSEKSVAKSTTGG